MIDCCIEIDCCAYIVDRHYDPIHIDDDNQS
jgi:hypothetical protein